MRRKPKENNFKAVLETIRDLMNTSCVVPDWLHDIILGYGGPDAAHYSKYGHDRSILYIPLIQDLKESVKQSRLSDHLGEGGHLFKETGLHNS